MRLLGDFDSEKEAYVFYSFLLKEGIQNVYEPFHESKEEKKRYHIWVLEEDDFAIAIEWLARYRAHPEDPLFQNASQPFLLKPSMDPDDRTEDLGWRTKVDVKPPLHRSALTLTNFLIIVCIFLFMWNDLQEGDLLKDKGELAVQISFTPLQESMIFDVPASLQYIQELVNTYPLQSYKDLKELPPEAQALLQKAENAPTWKGLYAAFSEAHKKGWDYVHRIPLFEKIRQGEVWRLVTPTLLHRDFLHILFNMAWAWVLGKQIEQRLRRSKMVLLILVIAVVSNVAQYLMSGPYFLGFSGVVVGMAGFIWMRQKKAPWEGYPLQRATLIFILFFVAAMFALELIAFLLQLFQVTDLNANIANTAHIIGGLCGMALGRLSFFSRGIVK